MVEESSMTDKPLKDRFNISSDEMHHRMEMQDKLHNKPLMSVVDFISEAIGKVMETLGVNTLQSDDLVKQQQIDLGITISECPPEQMGELSGFYIISGETPVAIVCDPHLASDGLAYLNILWIQTNVMEKFGGVKIR
jgi:hypothetical protein